MQISRTCEGAACAILLERKFLIAGELALDGRVLKIKGGLSLALLAREKGFTISRRTWSSAPGGDTHNGYVDAFIDQYGCGPRRITGFFTLDCKPAFDRVS